jgi:hypothetical protein
MTSTIGAMRSVVLKGTAESQSFGKGPRFVVTVQRVHRVLLSVHLCSAQDSQLGSDGRIDRYSIDTAGSERCRSESGHRGLGLSSSTAE